MGESHVGRTGPNPRQPGFRDSNPVEIQFQKKASTGYKILEFTPLYAEVDREGDKADGRPDKRWPLFVYRGTIDE
ncbi:hypothetical protein SAMN04487965_2081 [Microbulbifer donghaiensis]|uniref:Uncharacterized protein n=1 Tax=Microbulbifer donghaiensis TaxID=494016 RepID=A0A1M5B5N4_9GAMM|nr:hypothetical protein SAMN04487965_2081 [Microbulbifer donghaiensis]